MHLIIAAASKRAAAVRSNACIGVQGALIQAALRPLADAALQYKIPGRRKTYTGVLWVPSQSGLLPEALHPQK